MGSRPQRVYLQNNYLYRFPVEYSDLLTTRSSNEDERFSGSSNSSGSLLLRSDEICDSSLDFLQRQRTLKARKLGKKKRKQKTKCCTVFNRICLCLFAFLACLGIFFYWSMWLVKHNSTCSPNFEEPMLTNSTKFHWVRFLGLSDFKILLKLT